MDNENTKSSISARLKRKQIIQQKRMNATCIQQKKKLYTISWCNKLFSEWRKVSLGITNQRSTTNFHQWLKRYCWKQKKATKSSSEVWSHC